VQVDKKYGDAYGEEKHHEFVSFELGLRHVDVNSEAVCIYNGGCSVSCCALMTIGLRAQVVLFLLLTVVVVVVFFSYFFSREELNQNEGGLRLNITSGYIIALEVDSVLDLYTSVKKFLNVDDVNVLQAVNSTDALSKTKHTLPLYVQNLVRWGRHDHMQLYSGGSLGCLLSHMNVWKQVRGVALVLEEDANLDAVSITRLQGLLVDMRDLEWDLLMLEGGHLGLNGVWKYIGENAATCANWSTVDSWESCNWMGSRGYLITERGAQVLLQNAHPFMVQTDALMSLTATFDPTFLMYWPLYDIAHPTYLRRSRLWDGCIKCYASVRWTWYVVCALIWMVLGAVFSAVVVSRLNEKKRNII
jgi:GR25 family glycosyltransferase involved in LPS biosynthesis